ncbi:MAG TPA: biotin synthase BioB [Phycisphaerae bacterium]|nr:biotin synthase BioB [Phycisphaerae bacterium]
MSDIGKVFGELTRQVLNGTMLSRAQAESIIEQVTDDHLLDLCCGASRIRDHYLGREVRCCSIAAAKVGKCSEDCAFCSQSAHYETHVPGQSVLQAEEVVRASREAVANGALCFGIVNSGLGPTDAEIEAWGPTFQQIAEEGHIGVGASMGVLNERQARRLAELGVRRYNHNLQTSRRHFPNIIGTHGYDDRLATLRHLKAAGVELCTGALFGMGETWADRLDLAFELRELDPVVVPVNFLIPIPGTPLDNLPPLSPNECLMILAVYRFLLPHQLITVAGGRETQLRDMQSWIFAAGATGFLVGNYLTTCGRAAETDHRMVLDLGLEMKRYRQTAGEPGPAAARSLTVLSPMSAGRPCASQMSP